MRSTQTLGTILYVEDNEALRRALALLLRSRGFDVREADSGAEALNQLDVRPDVLILDVHLPDLDGFEICRRIKADPAAALIMVLLVSGQYVGLADRVHGLEGGADAYLTKPVEPEELIAHINALLRIRRAEKALVESEERYRDLFDNANDIVYTHDMSGHFTSINRAGERITGYTRHELLGKKIDELLPSHSRSRVWSMVRQKIRDGGRTAYELEIQPKNGQRLTLEVSSRLIERQGKPVGVQGIARDISDRKRLEEQLRQAQKMEAIGRLAGGVAHDFNNLLTGIIGYSELILHRLPPGHALAPDVEGIRHAAERAAGLTYQLLAFSRKQLLAPKVLNLNNVLVDLVRMLERLIREDIKLFLELEPNLERVEVDLVQLQQVIINLVVNARDAMPRGGQLTLATANIDLDGACLGQESRTVRCVMLSVRDTGCGMTEEVRARLFEPFFTTKDVGKGTGLGLSTIYGIVKQSGGHIDVVSAPGTGTTFKIYLPCYESMVPLEDRPHKPHLPATGNETVLVVEDEEMVRKVICLVLAKHGYHVLQAPDGHRALRLCERYPASIDLLVTDLVMPEMSGRQLAEQLAATRPQVRTLYLSGYTDDTVARQSVHDTQKSFLQKPFSPETLARKVREVLDS